MTVVPRVLLLLVLCASTSLRAAILTCSFSFGPATSGALAGTMALSYPEDMSANILLSQRDDGTQKQAIGAVLAIGDVEYAVLKERAPGRRKLLITQRSPLLAFFVEVDRVVTVRLDAENGIRRLRVHDPWFARDAVATGTCDS